jgi:hypothetical protein
MIDFNINSGKIEIQESLRSFLVNKKLIMRSHNETVSCDSGFCEVVHEISLKVKRHCNDPDMLFFINGDVEIAMDNYVFDLLSRENISIRKERNMVIDRKKHN